MNPIVVINPNSTETVTAGIDGSLRVLRMAGGPPIECITLKEGPPGIENEETAGSVIVPVSRLIRMRNDSASAFVIACFSDPGLHSAREVTSKPVLGIAECAMLTALTKGDRFGIISILEASIVRHRRLVRTLGLSQRFAADLAIGIGIQDLGEKDRTLDRMVFVGKRLKEHHAADVVIMGCAGMAQYRNELQTAIGIPVIEPTFATVTMAIGEVMLNSQADIPRPSGP